MARDRIQFKMVLWSTKFYVSVINIIITTDNNLGIRWPYFIHNWFEFRHKDIIYVTCQYSVSFMISASFLESTSVRVRTCLQAGGVPLYMVDLGRPTSLNQSVISSNFPTASGAREFWDFPKIGCIFGVWLSLKWIKSSDQGAPPPMKPNRLPTPPHPPLGIR